LSIEPRRIQAILFDVDGTLSDTDDVYIEKLKNVLQAFSLFFPGKDLARMARRFIMAIEAPGNFLIGLPDAIGLDDEIFALVDFLARHSHPKPKEHQVVPGVREMLIELSLQYPLAVVSARDEHSTRMFLDNTQLSQYFQCVATAQTCKHTKPYPDPLFWAAQQLRVPVDACLMVGDTTVDIRAGKAAGTQTMGVLCGFGEKAELVNKGADMILESTADLVAALSPIE
jgi:HAD superfamily hydrolase (TIGR01549 family)